MLKSIQKPCNLKKFAGQTIGIDAFGWLHRGTIACAIELALDRPTRRYVDFAVGRVQMLLDFGIKPYLIFDGDSLPSKAETNAQRRQRREESKTAGLALYHADKKAQAYQELQKATTVTPCMMKELIEAIKPLNVMYMVAPYEADAQLVYLERQGIIDGILSEDSDMLVYGAKRLITKLDQYAECVEIERADFAKCTDISLAGWTDTMFRRMAILSGCDYLPSIGKIGLKTAYRHVRKYNDIEKILKIIQFEGKLSVPVDYLERFHDAELTFIHHRVFCPERQEMVFMEELQRGMEEENMPYLGKYVPADIAFGVACGDLDPKTKEPFAIKKTPRPMPGARRVTAPASFTEKSNSSITSFFEKRERIPLAELDPNSLTPSPSQQSLLQQHRNASWDPRLVSSAPQMRAFGNIPTSVDRVDRRTFLERASAKSTYQPPKRPRLCSETHESSPSAEIKQSPFFAVPAPQVSPLVQKKARSKKAKRGGFDIWSDDSVDDVLLGLPDVQQKASPQKEDWSCEATKIGHDDADVHSSIPQSSPAAALLDETDEIHGTFGDASSTIIQNTVAEPFEDMLDTHIRMQRELKTFAYQSPSKREAALRTMAPTKKAQQTAQTFLAQTPDKQRAALASLPKSGTVDDICATIDKTADSTAIFVRDTVVASSPQQLVTGMSEQQASPDPAQGTVDQEETERPRQFAFSVTGSEDALIPNSEDESEGGSDVVTTLDLRSFAYVPA